MFNPERYTASKAHIAIYKIHQYIYTMVDFFSALMFIVGSIFYFYPSMNFDGTWLFLIGSCFFMVRPLVSILRELHIMRLPVTQE